MAGGESQPFEDTSSQEARHYSNHNSNSNDDNNSSLDASDGAEDLSYSSRGHMNHRASSSSLPTTPLASTPQYHHFAALNAEHNNNNGQLSNSESRPQYMSEHNSLPPHYVDQRRDVDKMDVQFRHPNSNDHFADNYTA